LKEIGGIFSAGETPMEALENLKESIVLYVE
jgi:predicted RNase H-like HicB family nuclease